jgi:hypothetical protein
MKTRFVRGLGSALCAVAVVAVWPGRAMAQPAPPKDPPRVTGVSYAFDILQTGNRVGLPFVYGLAVSVVAAGLPTPESNPQAAPISQALLGGLSALKAPVDQFRAGGDTFIQQGRQLIAPLAAYNAPANSLVDAMAGGMDAFADVTGPAIQPFDKSVQEGAAAVRAVREEGS